MFEAIIHLIARKFLILATLVPVVLVAKYLLFKKINDDRPLPGDFFYYSYARIATTHNKQRKQNRQLQNKLFYVLIALIVFQLILSAPVIFSTTST